MTNINPDDLAKCMNLLGSIFGDPKIIFEWLYYAHPSLNNRKPLDLIVEGNSNLVLTLLENMNNNQPS